MIQLWTVYKNPSDYPGQFVARLWIGDKPTAVHVIADNAEQLAAQLPPGLVFLPRMPGDDPCIVGVWL